MNRQWYETSRYLYVDSPENSCCVTFTATVAITGQLANFTVAVNIATAVQLTRRRLTCVIYAACSSVIVNSSVLCVSESGVT